MLHRRVRAGLVLLLSIFAIVSATGSDTAWSQSAINPSVNDQAVTPHASCTSLEACGVNFRLAPGSPPPPGARRLSDDIYHLPPDTRDGVDKAALDAVAVWVETDGMVQVDAPPAADIDGVIASTVNDPRAGEQYSLSRMAVPQAWDTARGDGIVIAVVDSGVDFDHHDLTGKAVSRGRDLVDNDNDATDTHGHGTHVASIAAAATDNGVGMAGVGYAARLLPVRVLGVNGSGGTATIAEGIAWAADNGARVINLSLGSSYPSQTLQAAVEYAAGKGALVVCAAGNNGNSQPLYPAAYPACLAVGATDSADRLAGFSNRGAAWVDVAAPGAGVLGALRGGGWQAWDGTSMAAGQVSGVAALVWSAHPTWTAAQVRQAIETTTDPVVGP